MKLVFIDESGDKENTDYLGLSVATADSRHYPTIKSKAHAILKDISWDSKIEFKGSLLFSASKGCLTVSVQDRVRAAGALLDLNASKVNNRMHFTYGRLSSKNHASDYLETLPPLLDRAVLPAPSGAGKNLISITCDERSDVSPDDLHNALAPIVKKKGYTILERVVCAKSSFETVGLMFADLVGYLRSRIDTIQVDADLFEALSPEDLQKDGRLRKLKSSKELIKKIKDLKVFFHTKSPPVVDGKVLGVTLKRPPAGSPKPVSAEENLVE